MSIKKEKAGSYTSFFGGLTSWSEDISGKRLTEWEYTCLYGRLRIRYSAIELIDGWKHIGLHYINLESKILRYFDWHLAFRSKYPFIITSFWKIWKLYEKK